MTNRSNSAYLKYIAALLLFGSNGIVASHIALSSYEIVFTRALIGSLFLILILLLTKQRVQFRKNGLHFFYLVISGVALGANWLFMYEAYAQIGVSLATLAYTLAPVLVMILSPILFREKMTSARVLAFLAVLAGLFCVNGGSLPQGKTGWGLICAILSAVMYVFMVVFNKKAVSITGLEKAMWQVIASFITVAIFLGFKQGPPWEWRAIPITRESLAPILLLGIVISGIGGYSYFSSIGHLPGQTVAILAYLETLWALLLSAALLREKLSPVQMLGAALILGGAALGELWDQKMNGTMAFERGGP